MGVKISELGAVSALDGTEIMVGVQSSVTKRLTTAEMAAYAIDELLDAAAGTPTTGDNLVAEVSGAEKLHDLDDVAAYVVASAWSVASTAGSTTSGDLYLFDRAGTVYDIDIDNIQTYILTGIQATVLDDISGLSSATLSSGDEFLVNEGPGIMKKNTLAQLETALWADYATYVNGLDSLTGMADADELYILDAGATAKKITGANLVTYIAAEVQVAVLDQAFDEAEVDPVLSTDLMIVERQGTPDVRKTATIDSVCDYVDSVIEATASGDPVATDDEFVFYRFGVRYLGTVDSISDFVLADAWNAAAVTTFTGDSDQFLLGQSGVVKSMTKAYVVSGLQAGILDISGLGSATVSAGDELLVCESGTAKKATLAELETKLWTDLDARIDGLTNAGALADANKIYLLQSSTAYDCALSVLATYVETKIETNILDQAFDEDAVTTLQDTDLFSLERQGEPDVRKIVTGANLAAYVVDEIGAASALSAPALTDDSILMFRSGDEKLGTVQNISDFVELDILNAAAVTAFAGDSDKFLVGQAGVTKTMTKAYVVSGLQAGILDISGLSALTDATISSLDHLLVGSGSTPKRIIVSEMQERFWTDFQTYVNTTVPAVDAVADADFFYTSHGGTASSATASQLAAYVETKIETNILDQVFDEDAVTTLQDTDLFSLERQGEPDVRKIVTGANLAAYVVDEIGAASALSAPALTDDSILMFRSGDEKLGTVQNISDFVELDILNAAAVTAFAGDSDKFLVGQAGVTKTMTKAYVVSGLQAGILDISGLSALTDATISSLDHLLVGSGSTPKRIIVSEMQERFWTDFQTYVNTTVPAVDAVADADFFYTSHGGTASSATASQLATYMLAEIATAVVATAWDAADGVTLADADEFIIERTNVPKTIEATDINDYVMSKLAASAQTTPVIAGYDFLFLDGTTSKKADVDVLGTYLFTTIWDAGNAATVTTLADANMIYVAVSGVSKQITLANLQAEILDGIQATVLNDISGLGATTPSSGDEFIVNESGTPTRLTLANLETQLWTDFGTYTAALADVTTLADADRFYILDGGLANSPKYCTADEICTYIDAELWADAADSTDTQASDTFLVRRSGTTYEADISYLAAYINTGVQPTVLNISGLDTVTGVDVADLVMVCEGTTGKKATVQAISDVVNADFSVWLAALAGATLGSTDVFHLTQSGAAKKTTMADISTYCAAEAMTLPWTAVDESKWTAAPSTTSVLLMSDTSDVKVGAPIKYTIGGTVYYAIITALSANVSITIAGAPFGGSLSNLYVGIPAQVEHVDLHVDGIFGDTVQNILENIAGSKYKWRHPTAYLVAFSGASGWADTGASQPKLNVKANNALVSTEDGNGGITLSGSDSTWVNGSAVAINVTNYEIEYGEEVELYVSSAGTNGDADCLSVSLAFVYE